MPTLSHPQADIYVPDDMDPKAALARTTHMGIGAHQDDLEIMAYHGISECFAQKDKWFAGVTVTNGAGSPRAGLYGDYTDDEMQSVRLVEQRKAAYVGEYGIQLQLAHPSSAVKDKTATDVRADLKAILEIAQPETVYLHNPADKHDTHVGVLARCIEAIRALPKEIRPKKAYACEVWRALDWLVEDDKICLPVGRQDNIAAALVAVFDSQVTGGKRYDLASAGRRLANATYLGSHQPDDAPAISYALDLMPLVEDDNLSMAEYTLGFVDRLRDDIAARIAKFS